MIVEGHFQKLRMLKKLGTVYKSSEGFFQFWQNLISEQELHLTLQQSTRVVKNCLHCFLVLCDRNLNCILTKPAICFPSRLPNA